jgi:signal recognition particle receptor subunit beta
MGNVIHSRILVLGIDGSGKTTFLNKFEKPDEDVPTQPTDAYVVRDVKVKGVKLNVWDVAGKDSTRSLWKHYYGEGSTNAIIWVIDSTVSDERLDENKLWLSQALMAPNLSGTLSRHLSPWFNAAQQREAFSLHPFCAALSPFYFFSRLHDIFRTPFFSKVLLLIFHMFNYDLRLSKSCGIAGLFSAPQPITALQSGFSFAEPNSHSCINIPKQQFHHLCDPKSTSRRLNVFLHVAKKKKPNWLRPCFLPRLSNFTHSAHFISHVRNLNFHTICTYLSIVVGVLLFVLANKQDVDGARKPEDISKLLNLAN